MNIPVKRGRAVHLLFIIHCPGDFLPLWSRSKIDAGFCRMLQKPLPVVWRARYIFTWAGNIISTVCLQCLGSTLCTKQKPPRFNVGISFPCLIGSSDGSDISFAVCSSMSLFVWGFMKDLVLIKILLKGRGRHREGQTDRDKDNKQTDKHTYKDRQSQREGGRASERGSEQERENPPPPLHTHTPASLSSVPLSMAH